ncbi:MAG: hypothetical protein HYX20_00840 [Candidatus Yanofskybacteria bacterium]|nr:hypothetical protein [Candidatus Yanofskybacteria bacterium]
MIIVRGKAYGQTYDYECELISRTSEEAVFETKSEPRHNIRITPRYVGSSIGSCDFSDGRGRNVTICAFFFDREYVALALFTENEENIEINPHEY